FPAQGIAQRLRRAGIQFPRRPPGISRLRAHPLRRARRPLRQTRSDREAAGARAARRHQRRCLAPVRGARAGAALLRQRGAARRRRHGAPSMSTLAQAARPTLPRYFLDRSEIMGPLFIAPAILYVVLLVGLPFILALYYSVSAFTIFNPSYTFVGLKNFYE